MKKSKSNLPRDIAAKVFLRTVLKAKRLNLPRDTAAKVFLRIIECSTGADFCLRIISAGRFFRIALCEPSSGYVFACTSCFKNFNDAYHFMCKM